MNDSKVICGVRVPCLSLFLARTTIQQALIVATKAAEKSGRKHGRFDQMTAFWPIARTRRQRRRSTF